MKYRFIKLYIDFLNWSDRFEWFFTNGRKQLAENRKLSHVCILYGDGTTKKLDPSQWVLFKEGIEKLQTKRITKYFH